MLSPGNVYNSSTFRLTSASKTNLLNYLEDPDYENFYFYGHGNSSSFGDYSPELDSWLVNITDTEVRAAVKNYFPTGTNAHSYRFVFLDSCQSANGPLPEAFGIAKERVPWRHYYDGLRVMARAFVGYLEKDIKLPQNSDDLGFNSDMLGQFMGEWRDGASLNGVVSRAKQHSLWPLDPSATTWGATNLWRYCP